MAGDLLKFILCSFLILLPTWGMTENLSTPLSVSKVSRTTTSTTLNEYLDELISSNPEIQSLLYSIKASENRVAGSGWLDDPVAGVSLMNIPTGNPSLSRTPMSGVDLSFKQKVPFPSKLVTIKKLERAKLTQTESIYLEKLNQLIAKFKSTYFDYAYVQTAIQIHSKNKNRLTALSRTLENKYTTDAVTLPDVLKVKVAIGTIENSLVSLNQLSKTYQARLNTLMNREIRAPIHVSDIKKSTPFPKELSALLKDAVLQRPWIQKAESDIRVNEKTHSLAKQTFLPDFEFMGSYRFRNELPGDPVAGENFYSAGVAINIPFLWSLPTHTQKVSEAKNALQASRWEKESVEQEVIYQVTSYYEELDQLKKQINIMESQVVRASDAAFKSSLRSYESNDINFLDVITSQQSLFTNELTLAQYKYDYEKAFAKLDMAVGGM